MERVKKGKKYWYVSLFSRYGENGICTDWDYENFAMLDNTKWAEGNYFHTQEEAEAMANKLRAVLKGADVIELPSEEEARLESGKQLDLSMACEDEWIEEAYLDGFADCLHWLKSKIVK